MPYWTRWYIAGIMAGLLIGLLLARAVEGREFRFKVPRPATNAERVVIAHVQKAVNEYVERTGQKPFHWSVRVAFLRDGTPTLLAGYIRHKRGYARRAELDDDLLDIAARLFWRPTVKVGLGPWCSTPSDECSKATLGEVRDAIVEEMP